MVDSRRCVAACRQFVFRGALWLLSSLLIVGHGVWVSSAAAEASPQIYVVDMDRVVNESVIGKAARANVQEEVRKTEGKLALERKEIDRLRTDVENQASLLSPAALEEKKEAVARREREFERSVQDKREEISKKHNSEMKKVVTEVDRVVADLSSRGSYPIILEKDPRVVVFASARVDLTSQIIAAVDAAKVGN